MRVRTCEGYMKKAVPKILKRVFQPEFFPRHHPPANQYLLEKFGSIP